MEDRGNNPFCSHPGYITDSAGVCIKPQPGQGVVSVALCGTVHLAPVAGIASHTADASCMCIEIPL